MWVYEKRLQYPVKIKTPNAKLAKISLVNMVEHIVLRDNQ